MYFIQKHLFHKQNLSTVLFSFKKVFLKVNLQVNSENSHNVYTKVNSKKSKFIKTKLIAILFAVWLVEKRWKRLPQEWPCLVWIFWHPKRDKPFKIVAKTSKSTVIRTKNIETRTDRATTCKTRTGEVDSRALHDFWHLHIRTDSAPLVSRCRAARCLMREWSAPWCIEIWIIRPPTLIWPCSMANFLHTTLLSRPAHVPVRIIFFNISLFNLINFSTSICYQTFPDFRHMIVGLLFFLTEMKYNAKTNPNRNWIGNSITADQT